MQGLGAVLYQRQGGQLRVIGYASRGLKSSETNYPAHKLEFLALKWSICDKFHDYLYGQKFHVLTDNNPLSYVLTTAKLDATGHRWLAELSLYEFSIQYLSGKANIDADFMSRLPHVCEQDSVQAICGMVSCDAIADVLCFGQTIDPLPDLPENVGQMTSTEWKQHQLNDLLVNAVYTHVLQGLELDKQLLQIHPDLKSFLGVWDKLFLKDGVLSLDRGKVKQVVLPSALKGMVLKGLHNDVGHLGRDRTLDLVRTHFFWPRMTSDVTEWVRCCGTCIRRKTAIPDRAPLCSISTSQPMELVCVDYLSLEPSKGGVENILVVTDHFTRFAYAVATKNQTAKTTANALYSYFLHYGFPRVLHADQGRNFESTLIQELCALAGITKSRTTPYHAMGNGMTERFNHTLLNMLGTLTAEQKKDWRSHVSTLVHAYNATLHDSTGYSPFFLMFGRHPRLPLDVAMGLGDAQEKGDHTKYVSDLKQRMKVTYDVATRHAGQASTKHKSHYDKRVRGGTVEVGDRVLVRNTGVRGKCKLANRWEDLAYIVIEQPNLEIPVYRVKQEGKRPKTRTLHRNMLLPINFLPVEEPLVLVPVPQTRQRPAVERVPESVSSNDSSDSDDDSLDYVLAPSAEQVVVPKETEVSGLQPAPVVTDVIIPGKSIAGPLGATVVPVLSEPVPGSLDLGLVEGNLPMAADSSQGTVFSTLSPHSPVFEPSISTGSVSSPSLSLASEPHINPSSLLPRPQRDRRMPARYRDDDVILYQHSGTETQSQHFDLDSFKNVMQIQHDMMMDVLHCMKPK